VFCEQCSAGLFKEEKKGKECLPCRKGKVPNSQQTACEDPRWTLQEDCVKGEYFNSTDSDLTLWSCVRCPHGANCYQFEERTALHWRDVTALQGFWRVPWSQADWSETPVDFIKCPYEQDCIGWTAFTPNATEACLLGTTGPLCSVCEEGYTRDTTRCNKCSEESFGLRVALVCACLVFVAVCINQCRKRQRHLNFHKWNKLWRALLRIASISITFAQINLSMPSVIEIEWPIEWVNFLRRFAFVNIDISQILGVSCIGDFNFYYNFLGMCCLPISIVILSFVGFCRAKASLNNRLPNVSEEEKMLKELETFQTLFELTDTDQSGHIDPSEMVVICQQLGWTLSIDTMINMLEGLGLKRKLSGNLEVNESYFVKIMQNGALMAALNANTSASDKNNKKKKNNVMDKEHFVLYTAQLQIYANALSTATQLLLLAHTPVSTKVFRFFQCKLIAGKQLLVVDYTVDCDSAEWQLFMPVVLLVLVLFTLGLPIVLSLFLFWNRALLYSARVYQKMGWLYAPYTKNAEWWQIHDVLMKMVLTGLLIYVPTTSRAGIAALLCTVTIANVNYFQPHKNRALFWLTQLSFLTTTSKYFMALLLVVDMDEVSERVEEREAERVTIGKIMIALDVFFMFSSMAAMVMAFLLLRKSAIDVHDDFQENISQTKPKMKKNMRGNVRVKPQRTSSRNHMINSINAALVQNKVIKVQENSAMHLKTHTDKVMKRRLTANKRLQQRLSKRVSSVKAAQHAVVLEERVVHTFDGGRPHHPSSKSDEHVAVTVTVEDQKNFSFQKNKKKEVLTAGSINIERVRLDLIGMIKSRKRMKKIFKKLDADQDSILSKAEFMVIIHKLLKGQKEILKTSEELLDLLWMSVLGAEASTELKEDNADNAIDLETFACWLGFDKSSKKKIKTKKEEEIEKHKDKNKNKNKMSFDAEFEADQIRLRLASASKDKFNKIFKAVDKDTSGKISTSEFEKLIKAMNSKVKKATIDALWKVFATGSVNNSDIAIEHIWRTLHPSPVNSTEDGEDAKLML
jgi:Ca2+-binding EF-hand superfamily protein